jgi:hypothetical protein
VNHYTTELVYPTSEEDINLSEVSWFADADVSGYQDPKWYRYIIRYIYCAVFFQQGNCSRPFIKVWLFDIAVLPPAGLKYVHLASVTL